MSYDELQRQLMRAATDLAGRLVSPPFQIRERPVLIVSPATAVKLGWSDGDYIMGMRVKVDPGTPPDAVYVTDQRTLTHEVIRVP